MIPKLIISVILFVVGVVVAALVFSYIQSKETEQSPANDKQGSK